MKKALLLSIFALVAAPAPGAETARCDATAFTLGKPAAPAPKAEKPKPAVKQAAPKAPKKTTSRLISTCKDGKKKSGG